MRIREHIASSVFFVCSSAGIFSKFHYLRALGSLARSTTLGRWDL